MQFDTGKTIDVLKVGNYLKEQGIIFVLDATQALGGLNYGPEVLEVVDVIGCSSYKWMLGPYGHAFGYFSNEMLEKIEHQKANWINSPNSKIVYNLLDYTTETLPGARKFDRGQAANMLTMAALEGSLDFLNEIGLPKIEKYNQETRDYFLDKFPKDKYQLITPMEYMANIVCLKAKGIDPVKLEKRLQDQRVDISVREGNLRLSFHIFNTKDQVDQLVDALNF